ncbi:unnamed protein product [Auanema sp. JU1783]|nr:unnamed protein product [Auanema sp. JU1783]
MEAFPISSFLNFISISEDLSSANLTMMKCVISLLVFLAIICVAVESLTLYRRVPLPPVDRYLKEIGQSSQLTANKRFTADMLFNEEEWPPRFI